MQLMNSFAVNGKATLNRRKSAVVDQQIIQVKHLPYITKINLNFYLVRLSVPRQPDNLRHVLLLVLAHPLLRAQLSQDGQDQEDVRMLSDQV